MRKADYAQQLASIQIEIDAHSRDFMKYGRALIVLREAAEASGLTLGRIMAKADVPRRKIYAVINAVELADQLDLTDEMAGRIGWSKLAILRSHITGDREDDDALIQMALDCNQATLRAHVSANCRQSVHLMQIALTAGQRRRFDKALMTHCNGDLPSNPSKRGKLLVAALEAQTSKKARPRKKLAA